MAIIGSDNGLSSDQRQAIVWTNAGILLVGPWETNCNEILIKIKIFIEENSFEYSVCGLENSGHLVLASIC